MDETSNLKLPYILAAQSQKHVTHNEALRALDAIVQLAVLDKDLAAPPGSPEDGDRYIVGAGASGAWAGRTTHVAAWQDGSWAFYAPAAGWLAWVDDESRSYLFSGGGWIAAPEGSGASLVPRGAWSSVANYSIGDLVEHEGYAFLSNIDGNVGNEPDDATPASTSEWTYFSVVTGGGGGGGSEGGVNPVSLVGVNATADATNRLAVASPASLFSHEGAGHQIKINKDAASDTASVLFQTSFSGRAEFGLAGDDDFHVKVSADGSAWHEALVVNRSSGAVQGKLACPIVPGGRLTLASGVPVTTSDVAGATTVYYTPNFHRMVPLYDGASFVITDFGGQLSQATADTTKSPAAVVNNSNYDKFIWDDAGTIRCTRGPSWNAGTAGSAQVRGTGAGSTELELVQGRLVNKHDITNGPAAQRGTYVGSIRSNGSAQIVDSLTHRFVWNMYNRVDRPMVRKETADSWTYSTASYRQAQADAANQLAFIRGLDEDEVVAQVSAMAGNSTASVRSVRVGIGLDSTSALIDNCIAQPMGCGSGNSYALPTALFRGFVGLGYHYLAWLEYGGGVDTQTWFGDNGQPTIQTGIIGSVKA